MPGLLTFDTRTVVSVYGEKDPVGPCVQIPHSHLHPHFTSLRTFPQLSLKCGQIPSRGLETVSRHCVLSLEYANTTF